MNTSRRAIQNIYSAWTVALVLALVVAVPTTAQLRKSIITFGHPQVPVTIQHPAAKPLNLAGKRLAFNVTGGTCASELEDQINSTFGNKGVNIVDRGHIDDILREQNFQAGSDVDPSKAVAIGRLLGPTLMVFVGVTRCYTDPPKRLVQQNIIGPPTYISKTEAHLRASLRVVDLSTGRVLDTQPLNADSADQTSDPNGYPEAPSQADELDSVEKKAVAQVERRYFPWSEQRMVTFMNGKECNLRQAYNLLKANDLRGALQASQEGVEACKSDPKGNHEADALYDLGIMYFLAGRYDDSLKALTESQRLHNDSAVLKAMADCREARDQAGTVAREEAANTDPPPGAPGAQPMPQAAPAAPSKDTLTNSDIINMVRGGLNADLILKMIGTRPGHFSTEPQDLLSLKSAGVPDSVISAMLDKR